MANNNISPKLDQQQALDAGFTFGRLHGIRWAAAELDSTVEPTEAHYVALETERDAAEAAYGISTRGWFSEGYDLGFRNGVETTQHLASIAGGAA